MVRIGGAAVAAPNTGRTVGVTYEKDLYGILGVSPISEQEVIEAAYRALMRKYHPDRSSGDLAALLRAREINEAYEILSDPQKRQEYNRLRRTEVAVTAHNTGALYERENARGATEVDGQLYKRCSECAEKIQRAARKCRYCGASQDGSGRSQSQTTNIHTHVYPSAAPDPVIVEQPRKRSKAGTVIFLLFLIFLLIILLY